MNTLFAISSTMLVLSAVAVVITDHLGRRRAIAFHKGLDLYLASENKEAVDGETSR